MSKIRDTAKLLGEFIGFARESKAYWIVPLVLILGLAALVMVTGQAVAPLLYTLF